MNRPEQALQISVVNWLRVVAPDLFFLHIPNGGRRSKVEAGIFKSMGVRAGAYDLLFILPSKSQAPSGGARAAFIELKAPGTGHRKPPDNQAKFAADCARVEAPCFVCDSLEQVANALQGLGVKLRISL